MPMYTHPSLTVPSPISRYLCAHKHTSVYKAPLPAPPLPCPCSPVPPVCVLRSPDCVGPPLVRQNSTIPFAVLHPKAAAIAPGRTEFAIRLPADVVVVVMVNGNRHLFLQRAEESDLLWVGAFVVHSGSNALVGCQRDPNAKEFIRLLEYRVIDPSQS